MTSEIVKLVAKKANLSEPVAQIAVNAVVTYIKGKLPPAVGGALDAFLGSGTALKAAPKKTTTTKKTATTQKNNNPLGDLTNIAGTIGTLLGKK
ncbi:MAG: hypothetical protein FWD56_05295 [Bacteroidales bacterium]|nr:hypothetical protein [Bacteroidales bacterium]